LDINEGEVEEVEGDVDETANFIIAQTSKSARKSHHRQSHQTQTNNIKHSQYLSMQVRVELL